MTQITLRGMEPELEALIRKKAKKSGKSLNKVILDMISENTGRKSGKVDALSISLKRLAGGWDEKEALQFFDSIKSCEQIDEAMWK
ncbi:MAG: hypothetical protein PVG49_15660 [Desulfobacteraceae bacterium]|jgi:hypothetical protein